MGLISRVSSRTYRYKLRNKKMLGGHFRRGARRFASSAFVNQRNSNRFAQTKLPDMSHHYAPAVCSASNLSVQLSNNTSLSAQIQSLLDMLDGAEDDATICSKDRLRI